MPRTDIAVIVVNSDVMDNQDEIEVTVAVNHHDACSDILKNSQTRGSK